MAGPLIRRKRVIAAKVEDTPGTAETLTASHAAFNVFDAAIQPITEMEERLKQASFQRLPAVPGARAGRATFSLELTAGEIAPGWATTFLAGCGLGLVDPAGGSSGSGSSGSGDSFYQLTNVPPEGSGSRAKTLTIGIWEDGLKKQLHGAMGNAVFTFTAGKKVMIAFDFVGAWDAVADATILAPTCPSDLPCRFVSSSFAIGAWTPKIQQLTLDLGGEVYLREDSADATGYSSAVIANRNVRGTVNPESGLEAAYALWANWLSSTESNLSFNVTDGTNTCAFAAGNFQVMDPQTAERNGVQVDQIGYELHADDLNLTFATGSGS